MSEEISLSMSLPLDSDGFLRRECPTCEREFKWLASQDDDGSTPAPEGGYFCPYCAIQAPADAWHTKPQIEMAQAIAMREVMGPEIKKLEVTRRRAPPSSRQLQGPRL